MRQAAILFIRKGRKHAVGVKFVRDLSGAHAAHLHAVDFAYDGRRVFVYDQKILVLGVLTK